MPSIITDKDIKNKSLLYLMGQIKSDTSDISLRTLALVQPLCREHEEFLKKQLSDDEFSSFQSLQKSLKEISEKGLTLPLDIAKALFNEGTIHAMYTLLESLEKKYKKILHGLNLDETSILNCLDDIVKSLNSIAESSQKGRDLFQGTFLIWTRKLFTLPADAIPAPLKQLISEQKANIGYYNSVINSFNKIVLEMRERLGKALIVHILDIVHKHGIISESITDSKALMECLSQHSLTADSYKRLTQHVVPETLWIYEEGYRSYCQDIQKIDSLHAKVHRLHYYRQAWNPSLCIIKGLCAGGIRYWSSLPFPSTLTPLKISKPTFYEHMSWADNNLVYHFQHNQSAIDFKDSQSLIFSVCTQTFNKVSKTLESTSNADSGIKDNVTTKEETPVSASSTEMVETKNNREDHHVLIEALFKNLDKTFDLYPEGTTLECDLMDPSGENGHGLGFKRHQYKGKSIYYFCDFNDGAFYSENLDDLAQWFKGFFNEMGYDESNYNEYRIKAIVQKTVSHTFNKNLAKYFSTCTRGEEAELKKQADQKSSAALLYLSKSLALSQKTSEEISDETLSEELKTLHDEDGVDDKREHEKYSNIIEIYQKIRNKTERDHLIVWSSYNDLYELQQGAEGQHDKTLTYLNGSFNCIEQLRKMHADFGLLEIIPLIQKARLFLKFTVFDEQTKGVQALKAFCNIVETFENNSKVPKNFTALQDLKNVLLKMLNDSSCDTSQLLRQAEDIDTKLGNDPTMYMCCSLHDFFATISSTFNDVALTSDDHGFDKDNDSDTQKKPEEIESGKPEKVEFKKIMS